MFTPQTLTLLVLVSSFLCLTLVTASPVEDKVELDVAYWRGIQKRNKMKAYNPDDEDNFEIQAQLDPVRKCKLKSPHLPQYRLMNRQQLTM
jgi:hypothetical protein